MSWELLIWNFQIRLEKEVLFETFETWNFANQPWGGGGCLFETFKWDLKWDVLFETFQPFQTYHESCLFETFRWDLKQDMLYEMFETWNFSNMSWELLIWNFQMRLETRYAIWNVWNLKLFKHVMGVAYLKLSDETWKRGVIWNFLTLETFQTFQTHHVGLLIWNFQMRFEMRCAIWNFWNLRLCSWNYLKCLMCPLRTKKFQLSLNLAIIHFHVVSSDVWFFLTSLILFNIVSIKICFYQSLI